MAAILFALARVASSAVGGNFARKHANASVFVDTMRAPRAIVVGCTANGADALWIVTASQAILVAVTVRLAGPSHEGSLVSNFFPTACAGRQGQDEEEGK